MSNIHYTNVLSLIFLKNLNNLKIAPEFLNRCVNEGFSGGEKKRNEILQLLVLNPKLIILDEIDSGLDMDALKLVCHTIKENLPLNSSLIMNIHSKGKRCLI